MHGVCMNTHVIPNLNLIFRVWKLSIQAFAKKFPFDLITRSVELMIKSYT